MSYEYRRELYHTVSQSATGDKYAKKHRKASKMTVLVIDDEPMLRSLIREVIELNGYQVCEAENGRQGLTLFHQIKPDLIILDIQMPFRDGFEVLQEIRRHDSVTGILMISGIPDSTLLDRTRKGGADSFLSKPFRLETFVQELTYVAELFHHRRQSRGACHIQHRTNEIVFS
jgi:DNA-binding response OmpR family regulator